MAVNTDNGYETKPKDIPGYKRETYYCECGCKKSYWHYVKIKVARKNETYYKIKPTKTEYYGNRFFKMVPNEEYITQVCQATGETKKGRGNMVGIYSIGKVTFFSNYLAMQYAIPCTKKEYKKAFDKVLKILK